MLIMPVVPREFRPVGPVYDAAHDRLLSAQPSFPPGKTQLCVGPRQAGWESTSGASAPMGIIELLADPGGAPLAVTNFDLQRLTGDPLSSAEPWTVWGVTIPLPAQGVFESVAPDPPVIITQPAAVALNSDTRELAVYTRGTLTILRRGTQDRYERRCDKAFKDTERQPVVLGFAGSTLLLGRQDGRLQVLDAEKLNVKAEFRPAGSTPPRLIAASPGGRWFASVFHHGHVWLYDSREDALTKPAISGQGDVSCAGFTGESQLLIADRQTRVSRYRLPDLHVEHRHAPSLGFLDAAYCRGLLPLYTVFPKPGELDKTFDYLLSGKETKAEVSEDLSASQQVVHPWTPLWSSALFLVALLLITCVYMERQDF
jgi:hypothetical protein